MGSLGSRFSRRKPPLADKNSRVRQTLELKNENKSVFYSFLECALKNAFTAKNNLVSSMDPPSETGPLNETTASPTF